MADPRAQIIATYAKWTVLSALRSGAPIKSRVDVYRALWAKDFDVLFDKSLGPISKRNFNAWHKRATERLLARETRLSVGWATKMINVYLKTRAHIGAQGRHHLSVALHPPIDGGLWVGLRRRFKNQPEIMDFTHCVDRIRDIQDYECYLRIIEGCRRAAEILDCKLIEVDQLWTATESSGRSGNR